MTPRQKQSSSLLLNFLLILFFFLTLYMIINLSTSRKMSCGCGYGCMGQNVSCPCYRRMMMNDSRPLPLMSNEHFTPQIGSDFTSYLNQVRQNQLKFSN